MKVYIFYVHNKPFDVIIVAKDASTARGLLCEWGKKNNWDPSTGMYRMKNVYGVDAIEHMAPPTFTVFALDRGTTSC